MQQDTYIRFDWAIKRMLRNKDNFAVLEGLITVLLGDKTQIVEILESESNQQEENDKFNRVNIKAKNSKGEIILVEVQNTREIHYLERILYGVAKTITEHIHLGESYKKIKKVYSISIVYFDLGKGNDYVYHGKNHFTGIHTHDELQISYRQENAIIHKFPREVFPEYYILRVNEFDTVAKTPLEEWMRYLKTGIIDSDASAPGLPEAREKLKYYSMSPAERHAYDEHLNAIMIQNDVLSNARLEGMEEGLQKGRAEGKTEGERRKQIEIAENMKRKGIDCGMICELTGLSAEEVDKLTV